MRWRCHNMDPRERHSASSNMTVGVNNAVSLAGWELAPRVKLGIV